MTDYIDAILHIADLPAIAGRLVQANPEAEREEIFGGASTPVVKNGKTALVYVRMTSAEAAQWRGTPLVTILAETPYVGSETTDTLYSMLEADPVAMALYDAVYLRTPIAWIDNEEQTHEFIPPFRFGALG